MDINEARSILARREAGDKTVTLHEHSAASVFLGSYYTHERPDLLTPVGAAPDPGKKWNESVEGIKKMAAFRDQAPRVSRRAGDLHVHIPIRDQGNAGDLPNVDPRVPSSGIHGALNATGEVSGRTVMRLPRSAASYALIDDGDGRCCVIEIGDTNNSLDPGAIATGETIRMRGSGVPSSMTGDRQHAANRQRALSMLAKAAGAR